jgi:hypothetical protein
MSKPRLVAWLGYGGLIPFLALAGLTCADRVRGGFWHGNLSAYGALILSFVGALHWGFAMALGNVTSDQRNAMFAWSVVPCLIAFAALLAKSLPGDLLLIVGFLLQYWQDRRLAAVALLPEWYLPLRRQLTAIAVVCLAAGGLTYANL